MYRTHHCNELRKANADQQVQLIGWIQSIREHGEHLVFVDLRDREGLTQVVMDPTEFSETLTKLKDESVIEVLGTVKARVDAAINPKMATGEIEVYASKVTIHNIAKTPPFPLDDVKAEKVNDDLRLQYRYLDLRRPKMLKALKTRHQAAHATRTYMDEQGFLEVETPTLFKSTPEGAREFLVPSRLNPGNFYALSQSPQQYKQMLMVAGIEKYYSLARCYRDEDLRADRQPEFTQIDLEMSFIDRENMYELIEGLCCAVWKKTLDVDIPRPFPRLPYKDAMNRYGIDKPDIRFGIEIQDLGDVFANTEFKVFQSILADGGVVKALNAKGLGAKITTKEIKQLEETAKTYGAKGLAYIRADGPTPDQWKSPLLKFFTEEELKNLTEAMNIEAGDAIFFAASDWEQACTILGRVRLHCGQLMQSHGLLEIRKDDWKFLWVTDFPLMLKDEETGQYAAAHHPFTAPVPEDMDFLEERPHEVRAQAYDIVLNGVEIGGGSIRIHQQDLQQRVFENVLKIDPEVVKTRFGYMLEAFQYGAPPHGGLALGFDRMCALINGTTSIRDVIAFPKTQKGQDLMSSAPGPATDKQLKDLYIESVADEE